MNNANIPIMAKRSITKAKKSASLAQKEVFTEPEVKSISVFSRLKMNYWILIALGIIILFFVLGNKYLVVAWVDKKPITRFEYYNVLDKRYGKDLREELIVEKLVTSEAASKKLRVTDPEIKSEIKSLEDQQGGADKLNQLLQIRGMSRDDLYNQEKILLYIKKVFGADITVSSEEVDKYIEGNKEAFLGSKELSATGSGEIDDKTKKAVAEQLKQTKINEKFNKWLTDTLQSSRVSRL